jgi:hypothetical protein
MPVPPSGLLLPTTPSLKLREPPLFLEIVRAAVGNDVLITGPTPHGVIVGATVLRVSITVEYLSVPFRGTLTPEMPLAIVPTSKTCVCLPYSIG